MSYVRIVSTSEVIRIMPLFVEGVHARYVHTCMRVHMDVFVCVQDHGLTAGVFLHHSSLTEPRAQQSGKSSWPASPRDPPVSICSVLALRAFITLSRIFVCLF